MVGLGSIPSAANTIDRTYLLLEKTDSGADFRYKGLLGYREVAILQRGGETLTLVLASFFKCQK